MSRKLFTMEDDHQEASGNDLIIDKLLDKKKEETSPLSLTADLLKRREEITKQVEDQLESEEDEDTDTDTDSGDEEVDDEESSGEEGKDSKEGDKEESDDADDSEQDEKKEEKESSDKDDEGSEADDEGDLENLMGSGLEEGGSKDEDKEVAKESIRTPERTFRPTLRNMFNPLKDSYKAYRVTLEDMGNVAKPIKEEDQPVVYVKEAILESLKNLTTVAFSYVESNNAFVDKISDSVTLLNERVTVFSKLVEGRKFHFTHKLMSDRDILANISYKDHSNLRETTRTMSNYLKKSSTSASTLLNSKFDDLKSGFLTQDFVEDGEDLIYTKPVPGFNIVKVGIVPYINYLKTKVEDYQYYKLKAMKTEDLYGLPAISITEDKDIDYVVENLSDLVLNTTVAIDTLKGVTDNFVRFVDELKVIAYNVQNDEYKKLSELGLDEKIQDFIKFKLVMEISYININLIIDYMTSVMSALNIVVELKEDLEDSSDEEDVSED